MKDVHFYTRDRCCLCEDALEVVLAVRRTTPFVLHLVDIEVDPVLTELYGDKIPVVLVDGRLHAKYQVDAAAFTRCLEAPAAPRDPQPRVATP